MTAWAIVACVFLVCGTALAITWRPPPARLDDETFREAVEAARGEMERTFSRALDEAAGIGETIKRHRARIDGATRGNPGSAAEQPQLTLESLTEDQVIRLPQAAQREWAVLRDRARKRA